MPPKRRCISTRL